MAEKNIPKEADEVGRIEIDKKNSCIILSSEEEESSFESKNDDLTGSEENSESYSEKTILSEEEDESQMIVKPDTSTLDNTDSDTEPAQNVGNNTALEVESVESHEDVSDDDILIQTDSDVWIKPKVKYESETAVKQESMGLRENQVKNENTPKDLAEMKYGDYLKWGPSGTQQNIAKEELEEPSTSTAPECLAMVRYNPAAARENMVVPFNTEIETIVKLFRQCQNYHRTGKNKYISNMKGIYLTNRDTDVINLTDEDETAAKRIKKDDSE